MWRRQPRPDCLFAIIHYILYYLGMILNQKHKKSLQIIWTIVGVIVILGMVLLYSASLFV